MAGIKTYVYDLGGGLIEFLAIGTAVKKVPADSDSECPAPLRSGPPPDTTWLSPRRVQPESVPSKSPPGTCL